jgi:hypothetical protein
VLGIAALEELAHHRPDVGPPEVIPLLVTLLVDRLELRKEALDQSVKWRLVRVPGTINATGLLGPAEHTHPPCGGRLRPGIGLEQAWKPALTSPLPVGHRAAFPSRPSFRRGLHRSEARGDGPGGAVGGCAQ